MKEAPTNEATLLQLSTHVEDAIVAIRERVEAIHAVVDGSCGRVVGDASSAKKAGVRNTLSRAVDEAMGLLNEVDSLLAKVGELDTAQYREEEATP